MSRSSSLPPRTPHSPLGQRHRIRKVIARRRQVQARRITEMVNGLRHGSVVLACRTHSEHSRYQDQRRKEPKHVLLAQQQPKNHAQHQYHAKELSRLPLVHAVAPRRRVRSEGLTSSPPHLILQINGSGELRCPLQEFVLERVENVVLVVF